MQTLTQSPRLSALQSRLAFLESDRRALSGEIRECPQPRDADGCYCDDRFADLCDERDELDAEIEAVEAEIDAQTETENP